MARVGWLTVQGVYDYLEVRGFRLLNLCRRSRFGFRTSPSFSGVKFSLSEGEVVCWLWCLEWLLLLSRLCSFGVKLDEEEEEGREGNEEDSEDEKERGKATPPAAKSEVV